jgi:mono/diheme cytochrome c family protein
MLLKPFVLISLSAIVAITIFSGCAKSNTQSTVSADGTTAAAAASPSSTAMGMGDRVRGRQIFSQNCSTCHGATGTEGGVGPSLRDERIRKNYDATIAWIKNPQPPMPKLYPSPLNEKAVDDVAAYVQNL